MIAPEDVVDTGHVDDSISTPVLEDSLSIVEWRISVIRSTHWANTFIGQAAILWCEDLQTRIQDELNRRRGLDGMTELAT